MDNNAHFIESWLDYQTNVRLFARRTLDAEQRICRNWAAFLAERFDIDITHPTSEHFIAYIEKRQKDPGGKGKNTPGLFVSDRVIQKELCILRSFYAWMVDTGHIADSPALCLPKIVCKPPRLQDWLSIQECFQLLEALDTTDLRQFRNYVIIALLWSTGLRVGELCALDWTDVNLRKATLTVRRAKGGKSRMLYLNDRILADLTDYRKSLPEQADLNGPVLISMKRNQNTDAPFGRLGSHQVNTMLRKHAQACGLTLELSPHTMRHTFATHMYEAGCTVEQIKEMLGHDDETESCIYIHISADLARQFLLGHRHESFNRKTGEEE